MTKTPCSDATGNGRTTQKSESRAEHSENRTNRDPRDPLAGGELSTGSSQPASWGRHDRQIPVYFDYFRLIKYTSELFRAVDGV